MLQIINKYLLTASIIFTVAISLGFADLNGDEVMDNDDHVKAEEENGETEKIYRSPFSLPKGVHSGFNEFQKGEVANSVIGIFKSGKNVRAVINGKWTSEGDVIGEEKVLEIRRDAVVMIGEEGTERELLLPWTETNLKVIEKVKPPKIKEEM